MGFCRVSMTVRSISTVFHLELNRVVTDEGYSE